MDILKTIALKMDQITSGNSWIFLVLVIIIMLFIYCFNDGFFPFICNIPILRNNIETLPLDYSDKDKRYIYGIEEGVLYTFDGFPILDFDTGEFSPCFSKEQASTLSYLMENQCDIRYIAYPDFTPEQYIFYAEDMLSYLKWFDYPYRIVTKKHIKKMQERKERVNLAVWKIICLNTTDEIKQFLFSILREDIRVIEKIFEVNYLTAILRQYKQDSGRIETAPYLKAGYIIRHLVIEDLEEGTDNIKNLNETLDVLTIDHEPIQPSTYKRAHEHLIGHINPERWMDEWFSFITRPVPPDLK